MEPWLTDRHVVLITTYYWPDQTGIAPYATEIAEHLAATGASVDVVTTVPHYPEWRIAPEYRRARRYVERRNGVQITRLWLHVPRRQTALQRAAYEVSFLAHALLRHRRPRRADVVISLVPNLANAVLGQWWTDRRRGGRHLLLVQDLAGRGAAEAGLAGGSLVAGLTAAVEGSFARRADLVGIVSDSFRPSLEASGVPSEKIVTFPNWSRLPTPVEGRDQVRARLGWDPDQCVVLHAGNMGMKQGLEWVAAYAGEAARVAPDLRFVLVGDGSQRSRLEALVSGIANVCLLPTVAEKELAGLLAAADILFVHERPGLRDMALPSKLAGYFSAGRPVVAAVKAGGATATEVERSGGGVVTSAGDVVGVVGTLDVLAKDRARGQALGAAGRAYANRYLSREAALARLDDLVDQLTRYGMPAGRGQPG